MNITRRGIFVRESAAPDHRIQMHDVPAGSRRRSIGEIVSDDRDRAALDEIEQAWEDRRRAAGDGEPAHQEPEPIVDRWPSADDLLKKFGLPDSTDDEPPRFVGREAWKEKVKIESRMHPSRDDREAKINAELQRRRDTAGPGYQRPQWQQGMELLTRQRGGQS